MNNDAKQSIALAVVVGIFGAVLVAVFGSMLNY